MRKLASVFLAAASTLGLATSCSEDDPHRHLDARIDSPVSEVDADIDAPPAPQPVTLTITRMGAPQANVKVYFLATDSSVIANTSTNASGVATAMMPSGGSVTAIDPFALPPAAGSYTLYTFLGAKPGDHLKLKQGDGATTDITANGSADATLGVASYELGTPCATTSFSGSGAPSFSLSLDPRCSTTTDLLLTSRDSGYNVLRYAFVKDKSITTTLDLTGETWTDPMTRTYEIDNTDVFHNEISVTQHLSSTQGELAQLQPINTSQGLPYTYSLAAPTFANEGSIVETVGLESGTAEHHILEWGPFTTAKYTLDAGAAALADMTVAPTIDTTAHTINWTEDSTGLAPDFDYGQVYTFRTSADMGWDWYIAGPHTGAALAFPTLPTDVADFTITDTDSTSVQLFGLGKGPGGYDAVRANVFGDSTAFITAATGTFSGEIYRLPGPLRPLPPRSIWWSRLASMSSAAVVAKPIKTRLPHRYR